MKSEVETSTSLRNSSWVPRKWLTGNFGKIELINILSKPENDNSKCSSLYTDFHVRNIPCILEDLINGTIVHPSGLERVPYTNWRRYTRSYIGYVLSTSVQLHFNDRIKQYSSFHELGQGIIHQIYINIYWSLLNWAVPKLLLLEPDHYVPGTKLFMGFIKDENLNPSSPSIFGKWRTIMHDTSPSFQTSEYFCCRRKFWTKDILIVKVEPLAMN